MDGNSYHLLVCGATFAGLAAALAAVEAGRSVIVIERTALSGSEFIEAFNPGMGGGEPSTSLGRHVRGDLIGRNLLNPEGIVHLPALHPVLCLYIKQYGVNVVFLTDIIEITQTDGQYNVLLYNASGFQQINVNGILDTSTERLSLPGQRYVPDKKWLNAYLHHPQLLDAAALRAPMPFHDDMAIVSGRFNFEVILQIAMDAKDDRQRARRKLHQIWMNRPEEWASWTIAAVAGTFMSHLPCARVQIMNQWDWFPSAAFRNPLEALDRGFEYMSQEGTTYATLEK